MSTTVTIGKLKEDGGEKGTLYTQTFFVLDADKAIYTPTYEQDGDVLPFLFPADTYIYQWEITGLSDHWLIVVHACDDDYKWTEEEDSTLLGCIEEQGDDNGIIYTAKYRAKFLDRAAYTPSYGIDGDQLPWNFPADTYIFKWEVQSSEQVPEDETEYEHAPGTVCQAQSWFITVQACNNDYRWANAHLVDKISLKTDTKGTLYQATYLVPTALIGTYTPTLNQDGELAPFGLPAGTYIYEWSIDPVYQNPANAVAVPGTDDVVSGKSDVTQTAPSHFTVTIFGCNDGYDRGPSVKPVVFDTLKRSFGVGTIYFDPEWYGIIQFQKHPQFGAWKEERGKALGVQWLNAQKALYPSEAATSPTDLIFANTTWASGGQSFATVGSLVISATVRNYWVDTSLLTTYLLWAGTQVKTITYHVDFWQASTKALTDYADWVGVNGSAPAFTPPAGCTPTGMTDAGEWKSVGQTIIEDERKFNNNYYHKISRDMIKAPGPFRFKASSLPATVTPHGPVWDW